MLDLALDTRIFINNELDAALQELDMIFNTENTELIGYPQYGTNWYQFLWQMNYSPEDLQKYVYEKIGESYFLSRLDCNVNVYTIEDDLGDLMYVVYIELSNGKEVRTKQYQIK